MASAAAGIPARNNSASAAAGGFGAQPRGERLVDRRTALLALAKSEFGHRRQARYERAKVSPLRVGGRDKADPVVLAGATVDAVRGVTVGIVAARLRRGRELGRQQRFGHGPQHRLDHREIDPGDTARPPPVPQPGGDDEGEHQPAHRVEPGEPDPWRNIGVAIEPGETGIALQQSAVSDGARLRPGSPQNGTCTVL